VFVHADTVAHKFGRGLAGMTCGFFGVAWQLRQGNRIGIDLLRGPMTSKNPPQFESHPVVPLLVMKETSAPFKCGIIKKRFMFVHVCRFYCGNDR
jgi:hypothetical protein